MDTIVDMIVDTIVDILVDKSLKQLIFQHANSVRMKHAEIMELFSRGEYRRKPPSFQVPESDLPIRENVSPGTW